MYFSKINNNTIVVAKASPPLAVARPRMWDMDVWRRERVPYWDLGNSLKKYLGDKFEGLNSVISMRTERTLVATGERTEETRYFISSLDTSDPEKIASTVRQHWGIENNLHWQLDVTFREDDSRKIKNAARNFSAVTKMALAVLKKDTTKGSVNLKRLKAGWDQGFLENLLKKEYF